LKSGKERKVRLWPEDVEPGFWASMFGARAPEVEAPEEIMHRNMLPSFRIRDIMVLLRPKEKSRTNYAVVVDDTNGTICIESDDFGMISVEEYEELRVHWREEPRPKTVFLRVADREVRIEDFHRLEAGGASAFLPDNEAAVQLRLREPNPGEISLPEGLDEDNSFSLEKCGKFLSMQEVQELAERGEEANKCAICMCEMETSEFPMPRGTRSWISVQSHPSVKESPVFTLACGHTYHTACLNAWFEERRKCPQCSRGYGKVFGRQPRIGTMKWDYEDFELEGHGDKRNLKVLWDFPAGTDDDGKPYEARKAMAYLPCSTYPCNPQGVILLELYKVAFRRRVMFGMGDSMASNKPKYWPTFNIHIKTKKSGGAERHGYPDETYFDRSMDELAANGVHIADLPL